MGARRPSTMSAGETEESEKAEQAIDEVLVEPFTIANPTAALDAVLAH
jgi:hypothetical protein